MLKTKTNNKFIFFLFLIWPFGSFVMALGRNAIRNYRSVILLFAFLFGYSVFLYSGDVLEYKKSFEDIVKYTWSDYWYHITNLFSPERLVTYKSNAVNTQPDIYALTMQFLISRFTENPRWFWAFISLIYTAIFLKFMEEVSREFDWQGSFVQKIFLVFLILTVPFYAGVTGVRFWTALFLFLIFALRFVKQHSIKYFLLASLSIAIHFSFVVPVFCLVIYRYLKMSRWVVGALILFSLAFFVASSNGQILELLQTSTSFFAETSVESRMEGYSDNQVLAQRKAIAAARNWYVLLHENALLYVLIFAFLVEFFGLFKWKTNSFLQRMYPLIVVFFCLSLLTFNLGSIGRFKYVFYLLSLTYYLVACGINPFNKSLRVLSYILLPVLVLYIAVSARAGFYYVDPLLLVSNPVILFFAQSDISLSELLVGH